LGALVSPWPSSATTVIQGLPPGSSISKVCWLLGANDVINPAAGTTVMFVETPHNEWFVAGEPLANGGFASKD
jgi:hypothetical protein